VRFDLRAIAGLLARVPARHNGSPAMPEPPGEHYFATAPSSPSQRRHVDVVLPDVSFVLTTDRGVFSHGHVDAGTALLLRAAATPPASRNLLDLGCGAGPIALTMALRAPATSVWAVDVNPRAVELTAANAAANGIANVRAVLPDDVPDDVRFDAIWSNPPIRVGKESLHAMLLHWFERLAPAAAATLVVQRHLGADSLQRWLIGQGYATERLASRAGYRLLQVTAAA
jgi:16S rRNA (guanine1207-N2)-methyltransferase